MPTQHTVKLQTRNKGKGRNRVVEKGQGSPTYVCFKWRVERHSQLVREQPAPVWLLPSHLISSSVLLPKITAAELEWQVEAAVILLLMAPLEEQQQLGTGLLFTSSTTWNVFKNRPGMEDHGSVRILPTYSVLKKDPVEEMRKQGSGGPSTAKHAEQWKGNRRRWASPQAA